MANLYSVATFRTLGAAATSQFIFSLENTSGSVVKVKIRRLLVQMDATAVLTAVMPQIKTHRATVMPGGGTSLTKVQFDTAGTASAANVVARGATASDGGAATAITGTAGTVAWQQYCMRLHTAVGQVLAPDNNLLPGLVDSTPKDFVLNANESIIVQVVAAVTTSNPATNHYFVNCVWEEV